MPVEANTVELLSNRPVDGSTQPHRPESADIPNFVYNKREGSGSNPNRKPYAKVGIVCLVAVIALIAVCAFVFNRGSPTKLGLNVNPLPENSDSTLISYKGTDYENYRQWTDSIDKFLSVYKTPGLLPGRGQNIYNCNYYRPAPPGNVCDVDIRDFGACSAENNYGYHKSSPCVFIRMNRILGWMPEFYNRTEDLPNDMPLNLKDSIKNSNPVELNTVWVTCDGENAADVENIGPIYYMPRRGFPGYYFPYNNTEGYLEPLVAVQFARPARGVVILIECKAWARNIKYDRKEHLGSVHFELLID